MCVCVMDGAGMGEEDVRDCAGRVVRGRLMWGCEVSV